MFGLFEKCCLPKTTVIVFGTFNNFNEGMSRLQEASRHGNRLVVGVCKDDRLFDKSKGYPDVDLIEKVNAVKSLYYVDEVFVDCSTSIDDVKSRIEEYEASVLVVGQDWMTTDKFELELPFCETIYVATRNQSS